VRWIGEGGGGGGGNVLGGNPVPVSFSYTPKTAPG